MTPPDGSPWPRSWREFWALTNRPRPVTPHAVRFGCTVLFLGYLAILLLRGDSRHPEFLWLRALVCGYALLGIVLASRFTWETIRAYTVGLGFILPLAAAHVGAVNGNHLPDLAMTGLATFVPLPFLVTGRDVLAVTAGLVVGHGLVLANVPPVASPPGTVCVVLAGSLATGAVAALTMIVTRAGLRESLVTWQQACERERCLREFTEVTAAQLRSPDFLDHLAARLLAAFGEGRCSIVLAAGSEGFRVSGTAGFPPEWAAAMKRAPLPAAVEGLIREAIEKRQAVVREALSERQRREMSRRAGYPIAAQALVTLPVTIEDVVAGVVVLSATAPRRIDPTDLRLWQAMANQLGVAVADAWLLARLERALRAKSEFLNTMSHELRSPLHVILGYSDMLREGTEPLAPGEAGERIRASALELLRLVEDTMTASQLENGRLAVRTDEFSATELVAELAESVCALPEAHNGAAIHWQTAADLPRLRLDRLKVKEIIQNLVSNALKFTPRGEVRVELAREDESLRVAVADTGVGIPHDAHERIFEMFERLEPDDRGRPCGVGLGLYIVNRLVRLMDGTIEVESAPGRGSRFTVRLPLTLDREAA